MEKWQRDRIKFNKVDLMRDTIWDDFLIDDLVATGVLGEGDKTALEAIPNMSSRLSKFYEILPKKANGAFNKLIKALKDHGQESPAQILEGVTVEANAPAPASTRPSAPAQVPGSVPSQKIVEAAPSDANYWLEDFNLDQGQDRIDFSRQGNSDPVLTVKLLPPNSKMGFPDDKYKLPPDGVKGHALVLNITKFNNPRKNRTGATCDTHYMAQLWSQLGYRVHIEEGSFTYDQVCQVIKKFKHQLNTSVRSCVVFIGSHGGFTRISCSDKKPIHLYREIIREFDSEQCLLLKGKPKMFFIQTCQGFHPQGSDSAPGEPGPSSDWDDCDFGDDPLLKLPIDDTLVASASIPGYPAHRDSSKGTWFIYCLTKVFMENAKEMDLLKMLQETQEEMRQIIARDRTEGQLCTYLNLGMKTLYFNMKPIIS